MRGSRRKYTAEVAASRAPFALVVCALLLLAAAPAHAAKGGAVTSGSFAPYAAAAETGDADITGRAVMVRTMDSTIVSVRVRGLRTGETYGSHVHEQACTVGQAGGHYRFEAPVDGGALDGMEIWPGPFTANAGGNAHGFAKVGAVAGSDAKSVVVHAPDGQKIACADLR